MPLSAILFDKDGTLVDFHRTWAPAALEVMRTLSAGDADLLARLAAAVHFALDEARFLPTSLFIAGSNHDIAAAWAPLLPGRDVAAFTREVELQLRETGLRALWPIGRPLDVFVALAARGLKLGIATNDAEETARVQLEALNLVVHLEFIAGYDSGFGGKPGPGMVHAFAARLGIRTADIALVGDTRHDLDAARAAGAIGVAVLSGPAGRADLEPHADHVLETIDELPALVDRLRAGGQVPSP